MAKASFLAFFALAVCVTAEPPIGYSYSAPAPLILLGGGGGDHFEGGHFSGGSIGGGGGHFSGGSIGGGHISGGLIGGGGYHAVPHGYQTSEGQYIDHALLEEIKNILLKDEIQNQQFRSSGHGHGLSDVYGAPSPVYGVPHYQERVVGIELGRVKQGIQVAQYEQEGHGGGYASGFSGDLGYSLSSGHGLSLSSGSSGFSSGHTGSGYQTIAIPAGSYGVPLPSTRYGSPHH